MTDTITIELDSSHYPAALRDRTDPTVFSRVWAIGHLGILEKPLLGFFCSTRCPGNIILRTYDLARAMRDTGISVIGGFHASMEKECLDLLLRGHQPVAICPARSIEGMRLPTAWRQPLAEDRLLVVCPFEEHHRRPTARLAEKRNRFVAALADELFVAHAAAGSKTEQLCLELMAQGKRVYTLDLAENDRLVQYGVTGHSIRDLVEHISRRQRDRN